MKHLSLLTIFWIITIFYSCTNDNKEEAIKNNPACESKNASFSKDVMPLLQKGCVGCHNATRASGGVNLATHESIKKVVEDGSLIGSITHANGFSPMPKNGQKLSDCNIEKIKAWINEGVKEN